jgi:hypothetical protein
MTSSIDDGDQYCTIAERMIGPSRGRPTGAVSVPTTVNSTL